MIDFGSDISTINGLDPTFTVISGNRVVGEALARRLTTPRGSLSFHPDYGLDVRLWLCDAMDAATLANCAQAIEAECQKDERVDSVKAEVTFLFATQSLNIRLAVNTADGPFDLVLNIDRLSIEILSN